MSVWLILLCIFVISCNCCFLNLKDQCSRRNICFCKNSTLICCGITSYSAIEKSYDCPRDILSITSIFIYNATMEVFHLKRDNFLKLESVSVIDGHIKNFTGKFHENLSCLNLSGNGINNIDSDMFTRLRQLKTLDVSRNNLTNIPNILNGKKEFILDISNNKIKCRDIMELLIKFRDNTTNSKNLQFKNNESTSCLTERSFHWFKSTDVMPLSQIEKLIQIDECPSGMNSSCTCRAYRTDILSVNATVKFSVNCSNLQLTELPPLPPNTIYLDVSNNEINSLELLSKNKNYSEVRVFIADNNEIESIAVLEGSRFIDNFHILSLRNNKIKSIPTYILSNAFDRTFLQRIVKFGENRLNCDCSTAQVKMWLLNNKNYIQDYDEVQCDKDFQRVIDIDPSRVCILEKDWTFYIHYIIVAELVLLLLLISKVSYDYWIFKTSGYLPWPASKMPKLPCDWCFET